MSIVNNEITSPKVRVRVRRGAELGVMSLRRALEEARNRGHDLVLMAPLAIPPLCEIMDMSQYVYNEELKALAAGSPPPRAEENQITQDGVRHGEVEWSFPLSPEQLKTHFGSERQTVPIQAVSNLPLPELAKHVLVDIGLPSRAFFFELGLARTGLLELDKYVAWWREVETRAFGRACRRLGRTPELWRFYQAQHPVDLSQYYRIGEMESGEELCIQRSTSAVTIVDAAGSEGYETPSLINSDIAHFVEFIAIVDKASDGRTPDIESLREELRSIDPEAMAGWDIAFWPTVLEEMENGVM